MDIQIMVSDLLFRMLEQGIEATVRYTLDSSGTVVGFFVEIIGHTQ